MREAFGAPARRRGARAARGGRALALGGRLDRRHERHARRDDPPALVVRRRRLARPRADADARDPHAPRGGDPRVRARAVLARRRDVRDRRRPRATRAATTPAPSRGSPTAERGRSAIVAAVRGQRGDDHEAREDASAPSSAPLLYDLTSLQREANTRFGFTARRTLGAAQRCYEEHKALTYPRTSSRYLTTRHGPASSSRPPRTVGAPRPEYADGRRVRRRARPAAARRASSTTRRSATTTRSSRPTPSTSSTRWATTTAASTTSSRAASSPSSIPTPCSRTRASRRRSPSTSSARAARCWSCPGWRGVYGELAEGEAPPSDDEGRDQQLPKLEQGEDGRHARGRVAGEGDQAAAGATPTRRCSARWRPPASSSTTRSCARR